MAKKKVENVEKTEKVVDVAESEVKDALSVTEASLAVAKSQRFIALNEGIKVAIRQSAINFSSIGAAFIEIAENNLYVLGDYKDVFDYAQKVFGLKETSVKNYMALNRSFGNMLMNGKMQEYNFTQLVEMIPVADKPEIIEQIKPEMSVKEIRDVKRVSQLSDAEKVLENFLKVDVMTIVREFLTSIKKMEFYKADYTPRDPKTYWTHSKTCFRIGDGRFEVELRQGEKPFHVWMGWSSTGNVESFDVCSVLEFRNFIFGPDFSKWVQSFLYPPKEKKAEPSPDEKKRQAEQDFLETVRAFVGNHANWETVHEFSPWLNLHFLEVFKLKDVPLDVYKVGISASDEDECELDNIDDHYFVASKDVPFEETDDDAYDESDDVIDEEHDEARDPYVWYTYAARNIAEILIKKGFNPRKGQSTDPVNEAETPAVQ